MQNAVARQDLEYIASHLAEILPQLTNARLFITGGTGFFGKWLLEALLHLNKAHGANCRAVVLSRNPARFLANHPHFNNTALQFIEGDIKSFPLPQGQFTHCIHAAMEGENLDKTDELEIINSAYQGTERVMEFACKNGIPTLFVSSGGAYGRQPPEMRFMPEDYPGAPPPTSLRSCYGEGKRLSEFLCTYYAAKYNVPVKIARCFAFVGPHLPLNAHFAIGNFISCGLRNEPIIIKGDGTPVRSYMYAADLVIDLFKVLISGSSATPYNIGSMEEISIRQLAEKVASKFAPAPGVTVQQQATANVLPERYVPDTSRMTSQFGNRPLIRIDEAIGRTLQYHRQAQ